jgi:hypothetical protein
MTMPFPFYIRRGPLYRKRPTPINQIAPISLTKRDYVFSLLYSSNNINEVEPIPL